MSGRRVGSSPSAGKYAATAYAPIGLISGPIAEICAATARLRDGWMGEGYFFMVNNRRTSNVGIYEQA